jgi:hypothetical protein
MNPALADALLGIELPRRLPFKTTQGIKPAQPGGDDSECCRRIRREGITLQAEMYHRLTLFVKHYLQTGIELRQAGLDTDFLRDAKKRPATH